MIRNDTGSSPPADFLQVEVFHRWDPGADLQVLYAGHQVCPPLHSWKGRRNHALVHHVLSGTGRVRAGKKEWLLTAGDSFLFRPQIDMWYEADRNKPWEYTWVGFGGTRLTGYLDLCGFQDDCPVLPVCEGKFPGPVFREILAAIQEETVAPAEKALRIQSRLFTLLETLAVGSDGVPKEVPYVQEILKFLDQTYSRPMSTETIARFAGLERTYCSHLFSKHTGQSLMQYLAELRMAKAQELLRNTSMSIRAVAESVGYPDAGAFSKRFRAVVGVSPSEARVGSESPSPPPH